MRVSTTLIFAQGTEAILRAQAELLANQQRIAAGKRILTPADDPAGAAEVVVLSQAKARLERFGSNIVSAADSLQYADSILADVGDVLVDIRTEAVYGGGGTLSDADRASIAEVLEHRLEHLLGLANSRGPDGAHLFSGYASGTQPFARTGGSFVYQGDQGVRSLNVADGRDLEVSLAGEPLFAAVRTGNGVFAATADAANAGSGIIATGSVTDPSLLNGHTYRVQFAVVAGSTTFDVVDETTSTTVSSGNAYVPGAAIDVAGMQATVTGSPASGDRFTLAPAPRQSVFATVQALITTLRAPAATPADRAKLANGVSVALQNVSQAQDAVLTARASLGARMRELESLSTGNEARLVSHLTTLSRLQDLDYSAALSDFARQQLALEAAQKSFLKLSGLSLFAFL